MRKQISMITKRTKLIFWGAVFVFGGVFVMVDVWKFIKTYGMHPPVFQYGLGVIAGTE